MGIHDRHEAAIDRQRMRHDDEREAAIAAKQANVYVLEFDQQHFVVEAPTLAAAVEAWKDHVKGLWGSEYNGTEEPDSINRIHDEPVIRGPQTQAAAREVKAIRDELDAWWFKKIDGQGLLESMRDDGMEQGIILAPLGRVLSDDGRVLTIEEFVAQRGQLELIEALREINRECTEAAIGAQSEADALKAIQERARPYRAPATTGTPE